MKKYLSFKKLQEYDTKIKEVIDNNKKIVNLTYNEIDTKYTVFDDIPTLMYYQPSLKNSDTIYFNSPFSDASCLIITFKSPYYNEDGEEIDCFINQFAISNNRYFKYRTLSTMDGLTFPDTTWDKITFVGKETEDGGEIFNDYKNNIASGEDSHAEGTNTNAIGRHSHASGLRNMAGSKAFNILDMNDTEEDFVKEDYTLPAKSFKLDSVEGLEVGDEYSTHTHYESEQENYKDIPISRQRLNFGSITAIDVDNKIVTVDNIFVLADTDIEAGYVFTAVEDTSVFVYDGIDSEENTFRIMLKPQCGTRVIGDATHVEGYESFAQSKGAHAEGWGTYAYGSYAHTEGRHTLAGYSAHAEGHTTQATDEAAHAEGSKTVASGIAAHAEGSKTVASGAQTHTEGKNTVASGNQAHAEGSGTQATGHQAHAEGSGTQATTGQAHAEGKNTIASGAQAHAEGSSTVASGIGAHAEGFGTQATGDLSHAEGKNTVASGGASHAEGTGTIARGKWQHVQGKYNIEDASNKYAHIVGYGTSDTDRKNIHTLDWLGNAWYAGTVKVGGTCQDDGKELITMDQLNDALKNIDKNNIIEMKYDDIDNLSLYDNNGDTFSGIIHYDPHDSQFESIYENSPFDGSTLILSNNYFSETEGGSSHFILQYAFGINKEIKSRCLFFDGSMEPWQNINVGKFTSNSGEIFNDYTNNTAVGGAHAEGLNTHAEGVQAHSEGSNTYATGNQSHAECLRTTASGTASHAEGNRSKATAEGAHAEGKCTQASGKYSHSEGEGTVAKGQYQHVQGIANIVDTANKYAHIVGGGNVVLNDTKTGIDEEKTVRKNIHTVDWSGNGWFKGRLKVGGDFEGNNAVDVATVNDINNIETIMNESFETLATGLDELVARKSIIITNDDNSSNISLVLSNIQEARLGLVSSIILSMPTNIDTHYESYFCFESGETPTSITFSDDPISWSGDDVSYDGIFIPESNKTYEVCIKYLGKRSDGTDIISARVGVV